MPSLVVWSMTRNKAFGGEKAENKEDQRRAVRPL